MLKKLKNNPQLKNNDDLKSIKWLQKNFFFSYSIIQ